MESEISKGENNSQMGQKSFSAGTGHCSTECSKKAEADLTIVPEIYRLEPAESQNSNGETISALES